MNKKQLFCLWCGIAVFVFTGLVTVADSYSFEWNYFGPLLIVYWPIITVITSGLVYSFRNKKRTEDRIKNPINLRGGLRRATFVLAIIVGLLSSSIFALFIINSRDNVQTHKQQLEYYFDTISNIKEFRSQYPQYNDINDLDLSKGLHKTYFSYVSFNEFVSRFCRDDSEAKPWDKNILDLVKYHKECLEEAKNDFFINLSAIPSLLLFVSIGVISFCGVWVVYCGAFLFYRIVKWVTHGFSQYNP